MINIDINGLFSFYNLQDYSKPGHKIDGPDIFIYFLATLYDSIMWSIPKYSSYFNYLGGYYFGSGFSINSFNGSTYLSLVVKSPNLYA